MKDIYPLVVNLPHSYVSLHKTEIQVFFDDFDQKIGGDLKVLSASLKLKLRFKFNKYGGIIIPLDKVDLAEICRLQTIENSYFGCPFFKKYKKTLTNRGAVYYITSMIEDDELKIIRVLSMLEISIDLLKDFLEVKDYIDSYSFVSILDEIRYKTLILYEHVLAKKYVEKVEVFKKLVFVFCGAFYQIINSDYSGQSEEIKVKLSDGVDLYRKVLKEISANYSSLNSGLKFKTYKEADHPELIWMFLNKLKEKKCPNINTIVGIRFGGIELPFLVQNFIYPHAEIDLVKISTYTNLITEINLKENLIHCRNILVVDDNILTGRTLDKLATEIKKFSPRNIFFACVAYSSMKRYPQMIMDNHGIVNPRLLGNICVVDQSCFTKINSSKSYKNKNGVFDKIKKEIQLTLNSYKEFMFKI